MGNSTANNQEYNVGIIVDGSVVAGTPGPVSTPAKGAKSGSYPVGTVTPAHSHPSGTVTTGGGLYPFGGNSGMGTSTVTPYGQPPSQDDIRRSGPGIR